MVFKIDYYKVHVRLAIPVSSLVIFHKVVNPETAVLGRMSLFASNNNNNI